MGDRELVKRARAGDRAAFDALASRYRATVFGAAYALLGDAADAEDATQDALTQAWLRLADLREPDRFAGWLYRIVQNRCRNLLARARPATVPIDRVAWPVGAATGIAAADEDGTAESVHAALGSLSEPNRRAAALFYLGGYRVGEVAALLGVPVGTAKRRLHEARHQFRRSLAVPVGVREERKGKSMLRLFTGKGDRGETDLLGGRVGKDDARIAVLGALDETTTALGLGRALAASGRAQDLLVGVQRDLYRVMAGLAFAGEAPPDGYALGSDRVLGLETATNELAGEIEIAPRFILPGDSLAGAALDAARAVARRAEREVVALDRARRVADPQVLPYLNRLSSFLFVLARLEDREAGVTPLQAKQAAGAARADKEQTGQ